MLRRFGLGATPREVRALASLSLTDAVEKMLGYESTTDQYPVSPWEFLTNDKDEKISNSGKLVSDWWALKMATTQRPLEEKMTLFWHDHFAVSNIKVQDARKMEPYLQVLRRNATGNFAQMLEEVSKEPAMILFLDTQRNVKGAPNENFAREVMELFTLGVDNGYTEEDIREAARALTGWYWRDTLDYRVRDENPVEDQIKAKVKQGETVFQFAFAQNRHDTGTKTIFGEKGAFGGDEVLTLLLDHPGTAEHICKKLWEWFAYPDPEKGIVEKLAKVFVESDYEIKPVLREIAFTPEFWSEKAVRTKVKSPVDFTIGIMRAFNATAHMEMRVGTKVDPFRPIHPQIKQFASVLNREVRRQGLYLLHPPSVEGWHWNEEWVSTESMLYRIDLSKRIFSSKKTMEPLLEWTVPEVAVKPGRLADATMVDRLMELLDVDLTRDQRYVLAKYAREIELNNSFYSAGLGVTQLSRFLKVVFAMPETHIC